MNQYTQLLVNGAAEMRAYSQKSESRALHELAWLNRLAERLEAASKIQSQAEVEREMEGIFHSLNDSGPPADESAPSLVSILDALQRRAKKKGKV